MIKFLIMQIRLGKIMPKQVPEKYRADVEKELGNEKGV